MARSRAGRRGPVVGPEGVGDGGQPPGEVLGPGRPQLVAERGQPGEVLRTGGADPADDQVVGRGVEPVQGVAEFGDLVQRPASLTIE